MKKLLLLWQRIAADAAVQCCTSASHDINNVVTRCEHEGLSVLTLSLPEIGKAFENALDQGQVTDALLSLTGQKRGFPVFLQNFLQLVFARDGGRLLDNPSVTAIQAIRQVTLSFGKVRFPCSEAREAQAFTDFVKCEQMLRIATHEMSPETLRDFSRVSNMLFRDILLQMDREVYEGKVVPKHGPGATADKLRGNAKYVQQEWTDRLEEVFPAMENLIPSFRYHQSLSSVQHLDPGAERPVRVVSVPKTMKTPRIIAIEPTCMQYMQQGLMEMMVKYLESNELTLGMIGIEDQTPNQRLAQEGSLSGELATLDLSEASDRVSLRLVIALLENYGNLKKAVLATRSRRADVPGVGVIPLAKFASMGSALTFPMEVMVFLTTIFLGIERELGRHLTPKDVTSFRGRVRVYGDDIIIPKYTVPSVVRTLEALNFKVNDSKSFWTGKFRESCGKEYYDGHEVNIFRVRDDIPSQRSDVHGVLSLVSLRNQAYWAGYWGTARYLDQIIEGLIPFPMVGPDSPVLGRESVLGYAEERIHPTLQHSLVRGAMVRARIPASQLGDEWALLKCLLKRGPNPLDERHLERQGRPDIVSMKIGYGRSH